MCSSVAGLLSSILCLQDSFMSHIAEVPFVLWMYSIPFLEDTAFMHANVGDLGCFLFGVTMYTAAMNILVHGFGEQHTLSSYLGVELSHRIKAWDF